ncbi:hypothetical protein RFI_24800 [Reticulomyxa filosa]|uniref:Uncharacterized protein n=1 Tax=Reticulomyxa filosa TaxID=46433 RepID=X6MGN0_RETFI|nr:hypothetical protein RFI_24800 [Reticulomyxa filosa]|eukprot:ETO12572.1 hypothetical protein RFI_24800 [Reticulomyxa filosa]
MMVGSPNCAKNIFCDMLLTLNRQQRNNEQYIVEWTLIDVEDATLNPQHALTRWMQHKNSYQQYRPSLLLNGSNLDCQTRKKWLQLLQNPKKATCVIVNFSLDDELDEFCHIIYHICKEEEKDRKFIVAIGLNRTETNHKVRPRAKKLEPVSSEEIFTNAVQVQDIQVMMSFLEESLGCDYALIRHFLPTQYFKFPRTRHLWDTGAATRDDILISKEGVCV